MSMLTLNGTVINIYESPVGMNKTTGEKFGGQHRIQVMCDNTLQNGEKRVEMIDLTIGEVEPYRQLLNKPVRVPVGVYVNAGKASFYAIKNQATQTVKS
jgi:hypothetical protein